MPIILASGRLRQSDHETGLHSKTLSNGGQEDGSAIKSACSCKHKDSSSDPSICNKPGMVLPCVYLLSKHRVGWKQEDHWGFLAKNKCFSSERETLSQRKKEESDKKKAHLTPLCMQPCTGVHTHTHTHTPLYKGAGRAKGPQSSREKSLQRNSVIQ